MFAVLDSNVARMTWDTSLRRMSPGLGAQGMQSHVHNMLDQHERRNPSRGEEVPWKFFAPQGELKDTVCGALAVKVDSEYSSATYVYGDGLQVSVVMNGKVANASEVRELYGLPQESQVEDGLVGRVFSNNVASSSEGAGLILALYAHAFEDAYHDSSEQPATCLAACEGSFSCILLDESTKCILLARSADSAANPMFWGTSADGSLLVSSRLETIKPLCSKCGMGPLGNAVPFPLGTCYYKEENMESGAISRLKLYTPERRRSVTALQRVNSSGVVCGLGFYSESGTDLSSLVTAMSH